MDFISSILGIIISTVYEFIFGKNFLYSKVQNKNHKFYWFLLIFFRKNFKKFIQDLGLNPWKYPNIEDLKKIRTTDKDDINKYFSDNSSSKFIDIFSFKMSSSGSSGSPFEFKIFILQWIEEQARVYSSFRLGGYRIGKKMVVFRSYTPRKNQKNIKEVKWKRWTYFNSFSLDDKNLMVYYNYLLTNNIKYLRTYPSTLSTFLNFLKSKNLSLSLKMIHVSSENISESLIHEAENYFGCKLINYYGQVEQAVLGVNLSKSKYLSILPYTSYYLLEDNTMAVLNLINWSNPLINYKVNDHFDKSDKGNFKIIGRTNIFLTHQDGYSVSTVNFYTLMQQYVNIVKWQIVQLKDLTINFNYEGNLTSNEKNEIIIGVRDRLGNLNIVINLNNFHFTGEGKINPVVKI